MGYEWKMLFNPDVSKQAQEVVFSRRKNLSNRSNIYSTCCQTEEVLKIVLGYIYMLS